MEQYLDSQEVEQLKNAARKILTLKLFSGRAVKKWQENAAENTHEDSLVKSQTIPAELDNSSIITRDSIPHSTSYT